MRYLKHFEGYKDVRKYWLLPIDEDRFKISLEQIGCTDMKKLLTHVPNRKEKYSFISYQTDYDVDFWGWQPYEGKLTNDWFEESGFKFQGPVNIVGDDPKIEQLSIKYNL